MVSPEAARAQARRRLVAAHRRWTLEGWSPPVWSLSLHPPTERQVLADPDTARSWVRTWAGTSWPQGVQVEWEERTWRSVGAQHVPVRLVADSPEALAEYAGGREAREMHVFADRVGRLRALAHGGSAPLSTVIRRFAERITVLPEAEFDRLLRVSQWLGDHSVAGLRPRQLPIRGVDSKWFSAHRSLLTALHEPLHGTPGPAGDEAGTGTDAFKAAAGVGLGIVDADPRIRLRVLDPGLRPAGLEDLQVPVAQAAALTWRPEQVLIVENLETLLCLPEARGVVAVWGRGFDTAAASLPWLAEAPIAYWGDLDSHGFAILHRYRLHLPHIQSVLMDESTLEDFMDLCVPDPKPFRGALPGLTPAEARALDRLRTEGDVRLEQERVAWAYALDQLASHLHLQVEG